MVPTIRAMRGRIAAALVAVMVLSAVVVRSTLGSSSAFGPSQSLNLRSQLVATLAGHLAGNVTVKDAALPG